MSEKMNNVQEKMFWDNRKLIYKVLHSVNLTSFEEWEDLVSIGNLGLIKAVTSFDNSKAKFSTYAVKCIRNELFMYYRGKKNDKKNDSLEKTIWNKDRKEITTKDKLYDESTTRFVEEIEEAEYLQYIINIIMNCLTPTEREVLLCKIGGMSNKKIGKILKCSRTLVGSIDQRSLEKTKNIMKYGVHREKKCGLDISYSGGYYKLILDRKIVNEILPTVIQKLHFELTDFEVKYSKEKVEITLPRRSESFCIIAQILKEIDACKA